MIKGRWTIVYATVLHLWWAILLLFATWGESPHDITAIALFHRLLPNGHPDSAHALLFLVAAFLAILALVEIKPINKYRFLEIILYAPQQFLLVSAATSAVIAMVLGQFGDGEVRPHIFIMADQAHLVLLAIIHTIAVLDHHIYKWRGDRK